VTETRAGKKGGGARRRRRGPGLATILSWAFTVLVWAAIAGAGVIAFYAAKLPPIDQLAVPKRPPNIAILADDGTLLANRGDTGGAAVRLGDLPPYLPKAFVAIEDRRFYSHWGVDPLGILRALTRNAVGGAMQGGSTLTQQLAKNLFLTQERTMSRKIEEAILAVWLEHKYSKNQILELYLNRVYFGSGAYGVEAAAQKYFGHSARNVTLAEAAVLAGLMKAPTKLAPNRNPAGAQARAAEVINAMAEEGYITPGMAKVALANPAEAVRGGAGSANYAADYVMDELDDAVGAIDEDIAVATTISAALQADAEQALTEELDQKGAKYGVGQGALVSMAPDGAIKALVGGRSYADSQFNRAVAAKRQPGSAFKPFVYLAALERGLTPASVREDAPINVKGWQPENYSHQYFGPVTLTRALSLSLNTVAVRLCVEVGPKAVVATAHRLGIVSELSPNASIALGTSEVSPLELVSAYAPFANGGIGVQPHVIERVKTAAGRLLYQRKGVSNGRVVDAAYLPMMNAMMQETLLTGTARKGEVPGWQAAGKTGTSQDWRDAWFVGYTSRLVTGVWLGNDDSSPTKKASGGNLPVKIWSRYMRVAHEGVPPQPLPGGIWQGPAEAPPGWPWQGSASVAEASQPGAAPTPVGAQSRRDSLVPPGLIPTPGASGQGRPQPRERNFFEALFGGG
jgi:penicillin-binding protein 1A